MRGNEGPTDRREGAIGNEWRRRLARERDARMIGRGAAGDVRGDAPVVALTRIQQLSREVPGLLSRLE